MEINYSFDGPRLLGTGGALKHAMGLLGDRFVVVYGDSYLPVDYEAIAGAFVESNKPALMTIFKNQGRWDTSNVSFESGRLRCYNKRISRPDMHYIDYGIAVLSEEAFAPFAEENVFDLADLYQRLVENGEMAAFEVTQRFYEIGSPGGLAELEQLLRRRSNRGML
jgi:NDP-sugar pyrophosphorylase family protein